jgi:hypothetical protein
MKHPEKEKHDQEHPENKPEEQKGPPDQGIVQPMIDELLPRRLPSNIEPPSPSGPGHPPQPAELDQDAGGGYNPDGTFPQT